MSAAGWRGCWRTAISADTSSSFSALYMTEAAQALVEWALSQPEIYRVWAVCDVENTNSAKVRERVGMRREGILRRWIIHPNIDAVPRDCYCYAMAKLSPSDKERALGWRYRRCGEAVCADACRPMIPLRPGNRGFETSLLRSVAVFTRQIVGLFRCRAYVILRQDF